MMLTRCPACGTVFRVAALQLKARQGKVRCGQCRQSFDALDSLIDPEYPVAPAEELHPTPALEPPTIEPATTAEATAAQESAERPETAVLPLSEAPPAAPRSYAWLWAMATFAALLLLLSQAAMQFRTELSILFPGTKPGLLQACQFLGCELALPHKADFLGIEASDMHPGPAGQIFLSATLRNRAPFAQTYPDLELTLTDTADQPLIRRVLTPGEYLRKGADIAAGFAANSELSLNLTLQAGVQGSAGYRIYLFYP